VVGAEIRLSPQGPDDLNKSALVLPELRRIGLMLESDPAGISVCSLIAGKPIRGSWWGHPKGRDIWIVIQELADHPDLIVAKLVAGKTTFVHRKLWPALFVAASSREAWQTRGLSPAAKGLLDKTEGDDLVSVEQLQKSRPVESKAVAIAVRELESRLLVFSEQFHTESGAHAKRIESWGRWARRVKLGRADMDLDAAKARIKRAVMDMGSTASADGRLPWNAPPKAQDRRRN
jgi:hypothetical protein